MSASSDKLGTMSTEFTTLSENLSASLVKIDDKILDLISQTKAIVYAEDQIEAALETYVETYKADYFYTHSDFGVSGEGGNLWAWMGFDQQSVSGLTYVNAISFTVDGDETSTFTVGTSAVIANPILSISTTISASDYNVSYPAKTYVKLSASVCTGGMTAVYLGSYAPQGTLWDSDSAVSAWITNWTTLHDFIWKDIELGPPPGTYGLDERLSNLYITRSIVQANKDKYDAMVPILDIYKT